MTPCNAPHYVYQADHRYEAIPPETANVSVTHGQIIAIPLYDGKLSGASDWRNMLRYVATISVPSYQCYRLSPYVAGSHRVALLRVVGHTGQHTFVPVELRLAQMHQQCVSCRIVHFFVRVR